MPRVERECEQLLVHAVEAFGDAREPLGSKVGRRDIDGQLHPLAGIAHVDLIERLLSRRSARRPRPSALCASCSSSARHRQSLRVGQRVEALHQRARRLVAQPGRRVAVGAEHAGAGRHDDRPAVDELRQRIGVKRAGAAEGDQREVARIVALLDRHEPQRAAHILVDDIDDALRRLFKPETKRVGDRLHGLHGERAVDRHVAAELRIRRQIAQHDIGVGHGRRSRRPCGTPQAPARRRPIAARHARPCVSSGT